MSSLRIEHVTAWTGQRMPSGEYAVTDAVLVRDGRIIGLGRSARSAPADEVLDGQGGFVMPAFGDGHVHPMFGGLEQQFAPVRDLATPEEVAAAVGAWARAHPAAEWVRGEGFDPAIAPGGLFRASWLDAEVPDRPVMLRASDYHTAWVNSEALRRAGYGSGVVQPQDGEIVVDGDGVPVGTLREWGAWRPVFNLMPPVPEHTRIQALSGASAAFASAGITWVQDAWVEEQDAATWLAAQQAGLLDIDADLALWVDPSRWRDQLDGLCGLREHVTAEGAGQVTCRTAKFFADGVIEAGTGALLEPYCDCPHSKGLPNWDPAELCQAVAAVDARGFTAHVHAIGDMGVRMALDAMEHTARVNAPRDRRWVIVHTQLVDPADLPRFAELGVIANFEPYWSRWDAAQSELTAPRLGPERTQRQYQTATLASLGARISFGSDWPVSTYAPLAGIQVAVTRQMSADGPPWMPEERISVDAALAAYTSGVAYQAGRGDAGIVRPGAVADLVWLATDPRAVPPMEIETIAVLGTWRRGRRTFAD